VGASSRRIGSVLGPILLIAVMVLVLPPVLFVSGMAVAAILGWALKDDAEARYEGSEYLEL
jgi:hypothetical protein